MYSHLYILIIDFLLVSRLVLLCSFKVNYVVTFSIYEKKPFDVITYNIRFLSNYIKALIMAHIEIVDLQDYLSIICKGMCITTYGNNLSISPRIIYDLCRKKDIYVLFFTVEIISTTNWFYNETKYFNNYASIFYKYIQGIKNHLLYSFLNHSFLLIHCVKIIP